MSHTKPAGSRGATLWTIVISVVILSAFSPGLPLCSQEQSVLSEPGFILWEYDYEEALRTAESEKDCLILAYFFSKSCDWCRNMEEYTFSDLNIIELSRHHPFLKLDTNLAASRTLMERFQLTTVPTLIALSHTGNELQRLAGYLDPGQFLKKMEELSRMVPHCSEKKSLKTYSLQDYMTYARKAFEHLEFFEATKALDYILYKDPYNEKGLSDEVLFLFGVSLLYLNEIEPGEILLSRLCFEYPQSRTVPDAMYLLGEIYVQTNRTELGQRLFQKLINEHPEHAMAGKAQILLKSLSGQEER